MKTSYAWGNLLSGGDPTDPCGYRAQFGYYTDHETGLILCGHRYYDPVAGRWLTRDPIGVAGGMNLYAYCGGDAVGGVDPEGTSFGTWLDGIAWDKIWWQTVGGAAGGLVMGIGGRQVWIAYKCYKASKDMAPKTQNAQTTVIDKMDNSEGQDGDPGETKFRGIQKLMKR